MNDSTSENGKAMALEAERRLDKLENGLILYNVSASDLLSSGAIDLPVR